MLLVIHNLPSNVGYSDIKELVQTKCGVRNIIVDNLMNEGKTKKVTIGVADESDAAIIKRKINGLHLNGEYLSVEDVRKAAENSNQAQSNNKVGQNSFGYKDSQSSNFQHQFPTNNSNFFNSFPFGQQTPPTFNAPLAPFMALYGNPNMATSYMGYGNAPQPVPPVAPEFQEMCNQQNKSKINQWNYNNMMGGNVVAPVVGYNNSPQQGNASNSFEPRMDRSSPPHNRNRTFISSKYKWVRSETQDESNRGQDESRQPRRQDLEYSRQEYSKTEFKNNYHVRDANPPEYRPRLENQRSSRRRKRGNENMEFGRPRAPAPAAFMGSYENRNNDRSFIEDHRRPGSNKSKRQKLQLEAAAKSLQQSNERSVSISKKRLIKAHTWCGQATASIAKCILECANMGTKKPDQRFLLSHIKANVRRRLEDLRRELGNKPMRPYDLVPLFHSRFSKKNEKSILHQAQLALKQDAANREMVLAKNTLLAAAGEKSTEGTSESQKEGEESPLDVEQGEPTKEPPKDVPTKPVQVTSSLPTFKPPPPPKAILPNYQNSDKKQHKQQKQEIKKEFETGPNLNLEPALKKVLNEEIQGIANLILAEAENPKSDTDKIICNGVKTAVIDHFKNAMMIILSKRVTKAHSVMMLRLFFQHKAPKKPSLAAYLLKYGVHSLQKSERSKMYIASCTSYDGFDALCAMQTITVDGIQMNVKPLNIAGPPKKFRKNTGNNQSNQLSGRDDDNEELEEYHAVIAMDDGDDDTAVDLPSDNTNTADDSVANGNDDDIKIDENDHDAVIPKDDGDDDKSMTLTSDNTNTVDDSVANDDDKKVNENAESKMPIDSTDAIVSERHETTEKEIKMDDSENVNSSEHDVFDEVNEDDLEDY